MRLQKQLSRKIGNTEYAKYVVVVPPKGVGKGVQIVNIPDLKPNMKYSDGDIKEIELSDRSKIDSSIEEFHKQIKSLKDKII